MRKIIPCDDRNPPWTDNSIKRLIQDKNEVYKLFKRSNNNSQHFEKFQSLQNLLGVSIKASQQRYSLFIEKFNGSIH